MATAAVDRAQQYVDDVVVSTTDAAGVIGKIGFDFGFRALSVLVVNNKADTVYVSFDTTSGSTGGFALAAAKRLLVHAPLGGFSLASTTTSTGDSVAVFAVQGMAWLTS